MSRTASALSPVALNSSATAWASFTLMLREACTYLFFETARSQPRNLMDFKVVALRNIFSPREAPSDRPETENGFESKHSLCQVGAKRAPHPLEGINKIWRF